jgi:phosphonate transport system substrate-binding protein
MIKLFLLLIILFKSILFSKDVLVFAPLPMTNKSEVYDNFYPMIKTLEKKLNKRIIFFYSENYENILEQFAKGQIDFAYLGPLPYLKLQEKYDYVEPLIHFKDKNNNIYYTCSLVKFIKSEKIEKVALTQALSTCGYLSVNSLLNNKLEEYKYKFLGKHDEVALGIIRGDYDIGGIRTSIAKDYYHLGLEEIARTDNLPGFALVGNKKTLNEKELTQLQEIILNTTQEEYSTWGKDIKHGVEKAFDKDYDKLRQMLENFNIPTKDNFDDK